MSNWFEYVSVFTCFVAYSIPQRTKHAGTGLNVKQQIQELHGQARNLVAHVTNSSGMTLYYSILKLTRNRGSRTIENEFSITTKRRFMKITSTIIQNDEFWNKNWESSFIITKGLIKKNDIHMKHTYKKGWECKSHNHDVVYK